MASIINAATSGGLITTADTSGILQLQTAGTTAVTVDASQNVTVVGSLTAAGLSGPHNGTVGATTPSTVVATTVKASTTMGVGGATPSASGSGITFPATQAASSDANTLDDYEEGTWEPVYTFSTSGNANTSSNGRYIKIGSSVWVQGYLHINASTACTGDATITGLPFTSNTTSRTNQGFSIGVARRFNVDMPNLRIALVNNTTVLNLFKQATNSNGETTLTNTDFNVQAEFNILYFQGTYSV